MNKELKPYRQKMDAEELQMYLHFRKRGGAVATKKGKGSYDRAKWKQEHDDCGMGIFLPQNFPSRNHHAPAGAFLVVTRQERAEFSAR